mmetsp:Transcript_23682/g.37810  ORF Transcript_23682/g.37810 Transcript_23682/m.37810 type:complete len:81 (-) Transcript_23682:201-443(-)
MIFFLDHLKMACKDDSFDSIVIEISVLRDFIDFALTTLLNGVYNRSTSLAYIFLHHIYSLEKSNVHIIDILYLQNMLRVC